jgi:hypothetical protein
MKNQLKNIINLNKQAIHNSLHNDSTPRRQVQTNSSMKNEIWKEMNSHFLKNTC